MKWPIRRCTAALEAKLGYDFSYMGRVMDTGFGAFVRFARTRGIFGYRKDTPGAAA